VKTPTGAEIEEFFKADEWTPDRNSGHAHWEKVLSTKTLRSHRSFSSDKPMSEGRFQSILRTQLEVSAEDFWDAIRTHKPVSRPSDSAPPVLPVLPLWLQDRLVHEVGLPLDKIENLDLVQAEQILSEFRSRPKTGH
jgi:hypothetical protein